MNNFDWIVTVAIGAIVGSGILQKDTPVLNVFVAVVTLLCLQYTLTKASAHWAKVSMAVRARPRLLFYDGIFLEDTMVKERVAVDEIGSAVRAAGHGQFARVRRDFSNLW